MPIFFGNLVFTAFPCWVFRAFPCWVFSSFSLLMCWGRPWDGEVTPLRPRQPDSIFVQCWGLGTGSSPAACCRVALLGASCRVNIPLPTTPDFWFLQLFLAGFFQAFPCWVFLAFPCYHAGVVPEMGKWPRSTSGIPTVFS